MCFGGKGTGGHQGGNANAEDSAIRKQFIKEGKPAKEARAYFRDRDAGKFLNSINYRQDELGNVKIDTAPKYFEDMTIAEVLTPDMYDSNKVNTNITFKERNAGTNFNNLSKRDIIQARSRYNKYGPGSSEAMKGNIKKSFIDMVDYAKDGTVQGIGPNKYMDESGKGQLVLDPKSAIVGLPSFTDSGEFNPKYDPSREGIVGKGLTNFAQNIQDNPFKLIPGVGTALTFLDKFKKSRSEGGGEDVSTEYGALPNRPQKRPASMNVNTYIQTYKDQYGDRGENIKYYSGTNYGMPTSRYFREGDLSNDANFNQVMPPSTTGSLDPTRGERRRFKRNNQQYIDMGARGEVTEPELETGSPLRFLNYAYNNSGSDDNDDSPYITTTQNVTSDNEQSIYDRFNYRKYVPSDPTLIAQSSYGGKFGSGQPNYMGSGLPTGIYSDGMAGATVLTPFFNPITGEYFNAPASNYYAEEGSNWRRGTPTEAYNLPIVA